MSYGAEVVVGHDARADLLEAPERVVSSIKRLMGRGASELKALAGVLPYELGPAAEGGMARLSIGGRLLTPVEVSADILRALAARARKALGRELNTCQWTPEVVRDHADRCHLALRGKVCLATANDARPQSPSSNARDPTASQQKDTPAQCRGEGGDRRCGHPNQAAISDSRNAAGVRHASRRPRHDRALNRFPTSTYDCRDKRSFAGGSSARRLTPCDRHRLNDEYVCGDRKRGQRGARGHDASYPRAYHCRTVRSE